MKPKRFVEGIAAIWLGIGVVNGASALRAANEAEKAQATATALEAQGNPQAAEWQAYADGIGGDRDRFLRLAAADLGVAALTGVAAASIASSRRREQEPQSDTSVQ